MFIVCIESSHTRGMGHLFRSLTLAEALRARGRDILFLVNEHQPSLDILSARGFGAKIRPLDAAGGTWEAAAVDSGVVELWIDDCLDTDEAHAQAVSSFCRRRATFDDRGEGARHANLNISALVFDDNLRLQGRDVRTGLQYMVLNPEIAQYRRSRETIESVLVTLGGSDTHGVTVRIVEWLANKPLAATVVTGPAFGHRKELETALSQTSFARFEHLNGVPSMAKEMSRHDLAITGGGLTPFEAAAGGLPSIVVANEIFEIPVGQALQKLGTSRFAGHHSALELDVSLSDLPLASMSQKAMSAIDLEGCNRVADLMEALISS